MINISRYNRVVGDTDDFNIGRIKTFVPSPTDDEYKKGYIERYFIQKSNDITSYIYEVERKFFSQISNNPFIRGVVVKWKISGDREEVREMNRKSIRFASKDMKSIGLYLPNHLQFHKERK
jgi:hypothetical protein